MINWISIFRTLCLLFFVLQISSLSAFAKPAQSRNGQNSLDQMAQQFLLAHPSMKYLGYPQWGGNDFRDPKTGKPLAGFVNPALVRGASPLGTVFPPTAASTMGWKTESRVVEGMYYSHLSGLGGFNGWENSDLKAFAQNLQAGDVLANTMLYPLNAANHAKAQTTAQFIAAGNALGELTKDQAANAIDYSSKYLQNFTADGNNVWNLIRNNLFVPIGILLLLPGAVLSQTRAMVSSGNPVLGDCNPFDGILRTVVAIFLIPASYLIVNYGIDFSNSIVLSMAGEYETLFGSNMYKDAMCAQIRAFPVRTPEENQNVGAAQPWNQPAVTNQQSYEAGLIASKQDDPCGASSGAQSGASDGRTDEGMPANAVAARFVAFGSSAGLTLTWDVLCAFQMAYLLYLFFVGPIMAGLWVWPMAQLRSAFPSWVEGVITICFWSLFWNTVILLMACFKGVGETGTLIMAALNFLAVNAVKFAFDFSGLVRAAGMEAAKRATSGAQGAGGAPGAGGAGGSAGAHGSAGVTSRSNTPMTAVAPPTSAVAPQPTTSQTVPLTAQAAQAVPGGPLPMSISSPTVTLPPSAISPQALKPIPQLAWVPVAAAPPLTKPNGTVSALMPPLAAAIDSAKVHLQGAQVTAGAEQVPLIAPSKAFVANNGDPSLAIQTSAGTFYLIPGGDSDAPILMVPTELVGQPAGSSSATTFGGVSYSPISLPAGQVNSIPLTNGGTLAFNGVPGQWSVTVDSGSYNPQSITLQPKENGAYELSYLNGITLLGSLEVAPSGFSTTYTAFNASGAEIEQSTFTSGALITSCPNSSNSRHFVPSNHAAAAGPVVAAQLAVAAHSAAAAQQVVVRHSSAAAASAAAFLRTVHEPAAYQGVATTSSFLTPLSAPSPVAAYPAPHQPSPVAAYSVPHQPSPALFRTATGLPSVVQPSITSPTFARSVANQFGQDYLHPESLVIAPIETSPVYARTAYLEFGETEPRANQPAVAADLYQISQVQPQSVVMPTAVPAVLLESPHNARSSHDAARNGHTVVTFLSKLQTAAEVRHVNTGAGSSAPTNKPLTGFDPLTGIDPLTGYARLNAFDLIDDDQNDLAALPLSLPALNASKLNAALRFVSSHRPGR